MYAYLFVLIVGALAAGGGMFKLQEWRYAAKEKERIEAQREKERNDRRAVDSAADGHEKDKARIRTVTKTINREVERIVREPYYVDSGATCFDADGLRQLQAAAAGRAEPASVPASAVRGTDRAR